MKNIHLLPTDKASRLWLDSDNKLWIHEIPTTLFMMQNIYITSNEEIKEGDWLLIIDDFETYVHEHKGDNLPTTYYKKIILTTDQDLIKDGVQAIDGEFLQWFVKNSSCEEVEVGYGWIRLAETDNEGYWVSIPDKQFEMQQEEPKQSTVCKEFYESADEIITVYKQDIIQLIEDRILSEYKKHSASLPDEWAKIAAHKIYKSILDKMENPKQHIEFINNNIEEFDDKLEQFKQASEHYAHNHFNMHETNNYKALKQGYEAGAKEMFDKMYSEEEVRKLLETQRGNCYVAILIKTRDEELAAIAGGAPEPSGYNGWVKQSKEEILEEPNISVEEVSLLMRKAPITFVPNKRIYSEVFEWLATKDYLSDKVDIIQKEFEQFKKK
jgi:hypothetical protein